MIDEREETLTPQAALERALAFAVFSGTMRNGPKGTPGQIISRMSARDREALKGLTAEHIQDVRPANTENFG